MEKGWFAWIHEAARPYDFCIGDPISCLLTFSVILREGFFPALVMVVKSNYIYILFVSIRF